MEKHSVIRRDKLLFLGSHIYKNAWLITLCCLLGLIPLPSIASTYPDYEDLYVNDFAGILTSSEAVKLRSRLKTLRTQQGVELTVVTIASRDDYGNHKTIESFATGLFNQWGVGNAQRNDGAMLLVAKDDRQTIIELGSGYGRRLNESMKNVIDRVMLPLFRRGEFANGIASGTEAIVYELLGPLPGWSTANHVASETPQQLLRSGEAQPWYKNLFVKIVASIAALIVLLRGMVFGHRRWRNRARDCLECKYPMRLLNEIHDDEYLDEPQRLEEMIESIDYDVWHCDNCCHNTIHCFNRWFSGYGACPQCKYKTLESDTVTLRRATTSSEGRERVDYVCHYCDFINSEFRRTARLSDNSRSSSSSSSSSSSFGGGSSSGGGASGSW